MDSQITKFNDWNCMLWISLRMGNYSCLNLISVVLVTIPPHYWVAAWQHWKWNWSWAWWNCHADDVSTINVSGIVTFPWPVMHNDGCVLHPSAACSPLSHGRQLAHPRTLRLVHPLTHQLWTAVIAHRNTEWLWVFRSLVKQNSELFSLTISTPQMGRAFCAVCMCTKWFSVSKTDSVQKILLYTYTNILSCL